MTAAKKGSLQDVLEKKKDQPQPENPKEITKTKIIFVIPSTAKRQIDFLAVESNRTKQSLFAEALNDLFKKHGKPPIA